MRTVLRRLPKRLLRRLPRRLAVPALSAQGWPRGHTEHVLEVEVPPPFRLEAYWLEVGGDEGPAYSLFHGDDEVLRADCFGVGGHLHYGLAEARHRAPTESRVYLPDGPVEAQVDRAVFELARNVGYCTGLHRRRAVRDAPIDDAAFLRAAEEVRGHLRSLLERRAADAPHP